MEWQSKQNEDCNNKNGAFSLVLSKKMLGREVSFFLLFVMMFVLFFVPPATITQ